MITSLKFGSNVGVSALSENRLARLVVLIPESEGSSGSKPEAVRRNC